jgi:tRNA-binding EMAP/Myf-like protein
MILPPKKSRINSPSPASKSKVFLDLASGRKLVIGEILSCEKHPDSDHLHVLQVNEGAKYGIHQIVCGAPNARKGLEGHRG